MAGLLHPAIAQVYDYGVHDDGVAEPAHFIVMELAPGTDLADLLRRRGRLDPEDAVTIATEVCAALTEHTVLASFTATSSPATSSSRPTCGSR